MGFCELVWRCEAVKHHVLLGGMQQVWEDVMGRVREARARRVQHCRRQGEGSVPVQELARRGAPPRVGRQGSGDRHGEALAQFSDSPPVWSFNVDAHFRICPLKISLGITLCLTFLSTLSRLCELGYLRLVTLAHIWSLNLYNHFRICL